MIGHLEVEKCVVFVYVSIKLENYVNALCLDSFQLCSPICDIIC